ncbi:ankyrin repeat-containing domain protein [Geopyxis carbonaria]|nr:ankyrin repeat-containing domain protein [Geopyxis carbonaria]
MPDVNDTGLTSLHAPPAAAAASPNVVDIIFIHGYNSHPKGGWTKENGTFWPAELLPPEVPTGRVWTWGWDSTQLFGDGYCRAHFRELAQMLLRDVANARADDGTEAADERGIVWVCHSLGGMVLKQALAMATTDRRYGTMKTATYGIVFLGTPHHGLDPSAWGKIITNVVKITTHALRPNAIQLVDGDSKALMDIAEDFVHLNSVCQIVSFYEMRETKIKRGLIPLRLTVIDETSARLNIEDEVVIPLDTDHSEISKFEDSKDVNFWRVVTHIRKLVMDAPAAIKSRCSAASSFIDNQLHDLKSPNLPPPAKAFFGRRAELDGLRRYFRQQLPPLQYVASIRGLGGIGKKQLIIRFTNEEFSRYACVFWIDCSNVDSVKTSARNIIRGIVTETNKYFPQLDATSMAWKLGLDTSEGKSSSMDLVNDKAVRSLRNWLTSELNTDWLLVLDSWNGPDSVDIQDLFPQCTHGHIIITSRSRAVPVYGCQIDIKGLNEEAGLSLLLTGLNDQTYLTNGAGYRLLALLGGIPLAIEQAKASIRRNKIAVSQYITLFESQYAELMNLRYPHSQNRTVFSSLEITFKSLVDSVPDAVRFLSFLSFLEPNNLWIDLIQKAGDVILSDQDPAAKAIAARLQWLTELVQDDIRINVVYFALSAETSLMKEEQHGSSTRMVFHPLVLHWARHRLSDEDEQKICAEATAFCSVLCSIKSDKWSFNHRNITNMNECLSEFKRIISPESRDTVEGEFSLEFTYVAEVFGDLLASQNQNSSEVQSLYERAVQGRGVFEVKVSSYPENKQKFLDLKEKLGLLFKRLGDLEKAEEYLEYSFRERVRLQAESKKTSNLYSLLRKVRDQKYQIADAEHRIRVSFMTGKPQVIEENSGFKEELSLRERIDQCSISHGPSDPLTIEAIDALGSYYINKKLWEKAKECARLEISRKGSSDGNVAQVSMGVLYKLQSALDNDLISAVKQMDDTMVINLLRAGANPNAIRERTPLQIAAQLPSPDGVRMVDVLLKNGADIDKPGNDFGSALQAAAYEPWGYDSIAFLLEKGADVNAPPGPWGGTALQAAASAGSVKNTQLLLSKGANVHQGGHLYSNALHAALRKDRAETARLLLDHGAKLTEAICTEAMNNCSLQTVTSILPPDIEVFENKKGKWLQMAAKSPVSALEKVEFALKSGIDVNSQHPGEHGYALHAAASVGDENLNVIHYLLEKGADVNARGGRHGYALQEACRAGAFDVVKLLVFYGADVHAEGGVYGTALQAAVRVDASDVIRFLLDNGADVNFYCDLTEDGTALQTAVSCSRRYATIRMLLTSGADVNACGRNGSALQAAVVQGNHGVVRLLLDHGADIGIGAGEYGSPLEAAWCLESKSMQALLLKKILTELEEYVANYLKNNGADSPETQ